MGIPISKRILRMLDPAGERERITMRQARCVAEANADDLARTLTTNREEIIEMMRMYRERKQERAKP